MGVGGAAQPESDHAGSNGGVAVAINQDELAGELVLFVGIEGNRINRGHIDERDFVTMQFLCRQMLHCVDVEPILQFRHRCANRLRAGFDQVTSPWEQRRFRQPDKMRGESVGPLLRFVCISDIN